ncbi:alpha-L-arabinofuranosidase C-terminal domain-containing protein [Granulicella tundricola]|uniref:non-reducing end alpha-L-arabinofuranosidase n=1 Tax=Granulicella tundricola (strain ATCC BAA-1859 / DSM 23138 / MP5ACTX9) TaxID=1198114 RepID=E8WZI8_GRATM|nr:alpha-L-arabinofuranosidase C-terminal domain-containing protein [Granulicella tundricola]ADW68876.1 alpha-L-arabinofuranosidase domain protein [Granulicella tundricola MP5ACTX9]
MKIQYRLCLVTFCLVAPVLQAQTPTLTIDASKPVTAVSPTLYGLMTEEINYSYDGGLYAEMVRNRTFHDHWPPFEYWTVVAQKSATAQLKYGSTGPSAALSKSLQLTIVDAGPGNEAGISNPGYWGMAVQPSTTYKGSFYAKVDHPNVAHARLIADDSGNVLAQAAIVLPVGDWKQFQYVLHSQPNVTASSRNHLELTFEHPGIVNLQLVSLFSPTFNNTPNGNRPDLMKMMSAMSPKFLRLPGGNYLEGDYINERFEWKKTLGPLVDRPTHRGPWGYQSTDGMGLLEFLKWCEDLKIEPVLAVYAGYSLKGYHVQPGKDLEPFVLDALDEIEYVTGDPGTKWGAERAKEGHPKPFPLHYIEVGNEDWFDKSKSYDARFEQFASAIRQKYPAYKLIATAPVTQGQPDVIDDHYYLTPEEFFSPDQNQKYDKMDRKGPKIFIGEWATRTGSPTPDFGAALGDASWMTSMERNSDLIVMASYAPLLTNINPGGMQWSTDLIGYDSLRSYASPSYWAQVLFAAHLGDHTIRTSGSGLDPRFFWSATTSEKNHMLYLKLVNASAEPQAITLALNGVHSGSAQLSSLHAATRSATNSIERPNAIAPVQSRVNVVDGQWKHTIPGNSIEVLDIPLK